MGDMKVGEEGKVRPQRACSGSARRRSEMATIDFTCAELNSTLAIGDQAAEPEGPKFDWMPAGMKPMADGEYDVIVMVRT